jgi:coenzyme F420-reducing hydrogenase gamma subunit
MIGGRESPESLRGCGRGGGLGQLRVERLACRRPSPNPNGATPITKLVNKPVINVPGCPPIADVMMSVVTHLLVLGQVPELDSLGRPKEFYRRRVRHLLSPRQLRCRPLRRVVGRRECAQGILPVQDGLQGPGYV